jgi:hypothetical protein
MHTTYGMDTCIETNENRAFGMEVYSRCIPGICKDLEYVRHIPDIRLTYDTIRIPDERPRLLGDAGEWRFDATAAPTVPRSAPSSSPVTVHLWLEQLLPELHGHGVTCGIQQDAPPPTQPPPQRTQEPNRSNARNHSDSCSHDRCSQPPRPLCPCTCPLLHIWNLIPMDKTCTY